LCIVEPWHVMELLHGNLFPIFQHSLLQTLVSMLDGFSSVVVVLFDHLWLYKSYLVNMSVPATTDLVIIRETICSFLQ
jgi:hypothetical protein